MEQNTHSGGIDLVWEGIGNDDWDMIVRGGQELVSEGTFSDIGDQILEVVASEDRTWNKVEDLVAEFVKRTTTEQLSDQEVVDAAIRQSLAK
jgi:hypothetical protein